MPLCLTTVDRPACVPVFIHLRKYHSKPHLSCIGCSLTFHFVWQTLIFTSKVLSRHLTHTYLLCCLSRGCFGRNCRNPLKHKHAQKPTQIDITFDGRLRICGMRTLVRDKMRGVVVVCRGLSKQLFCSCCVFTGVLFMRGNKLGTVESRFP